MRYDPHMKVPQRVADRIQAWAVRSEPTGCLISRYSVGSHGYAQVGWVENGVRHMTTAHRALWRALEGEIPNGMTVDHLCHTKKCVEIQHLRLLSNSDNAKDNGRVRVNPETLHRCMQGHLMVLGGDGRRYCRECKNTQRRARRALGKAN